MTMSCFSKVIRALHHGSAHMRRAPLQRSNSGRERGEGREDAAPTGSPLSILGEHKRPLQPYHLAVLLLSCLCCARPPFCTFASFVLLLRLPRCYHVRLLFSAALPPASEASHAKCSCCSLFVEAVQRWEGRQQTCVARGQHQNTKTAPDHALTHGLSARFSFTSCSLSVVINDKKGEERRKEKKRNPGGRTGRRVET